MLCHCGEPKPKPRFKVAVANLLAKLPAAKRAEAFTELLSRPGVRIERIRFEGHGDDVTRTAQVVLYGDRGTPYYTVLPLEGYRIKVERRDLSGLRERIARWRGLADLDARAGAPVGDALREACDELERLADAAQDGGEA